MAATAYRILDRIRDQADFAGPPTNGAVRYNTATGKFSTAPTRTVYTSDIPGVVLDATADASNTYGTDNTAAIQDVLAGGNIHLVNDGPCLCDNLELESNTTVACLTRSPAHGFYRKGAPNSGRPPFTNKNWVLGPTAPTDSNITFRNFWGDGNRRGYGSGNDGSNPTFTGLLYRAIANLLGYLVPYFGLYGVQDFLFDNVRLYDTPCFGVQLSNCLDGFFWRYSKWRAAGLGATSDDILHMNGHCWRVTGRGIAGTAADDAIAYNPSDGHELGPSPTTYAPGSVASGPIVGCGFSHLRFPGVFQVARFLSASAANYIKDAFLDDIEATIGIDPDYGYAAFLFDTFGLPGDGTYGLADGVRISRAVIYGNHTGDGDGFASVHMGRCNVKRLDVEGYRYRGYSAQPIAVVHSTVDAKVETLVLDGVVNESILPIAPVLTLKGNHKAVVVDGIEYDMLAAGPDYPQPQFRDAEMVRVAGPVVSLAVRNSRGAGLSHLVKCVGYAPANLSLTTSSLLGSNGGAAVKSDTPLPWLHVAGVDADHCEDVPAGSMIKSDGSGRYDVRYLRDLFGGVANAVIAGSTATDGSVWQADAANHLKSSGNNTAFLGGASSFTAAGASAQPTTPSFTVKCQFPRLSSIAAGDGIGHTLFATGAGDLTDHYKLLFRGASFDLMHNTTVLATSGLIPAVGGTRWTRTAVYRVPGTDDYRITVDYSDDVGRSWANLIPTTYFTTATPALVGLRGESTAGWTSTTGHHVGSIVVSSYSEPVPGPYVPPITDPDIYITADAGTFQTVGGTAATANNDPVGSALDQSAFAHDLAQATSGKRATLIIPGRNGLPLLRFAGGGTEQALIRANYAPAPPFVLIFAFKAPAGGADKELMGWGNNAFGGGRFGVFYQSSRSIGAENAGSVRAGSVLTAGNAYVIVQKMAVDGLNNMRQWINGVEDTLSGGSGTVVAGTGAVELKLGGIPTLEGVGYDPAFDFYGFKIIPVDLSDSDIVAQSNLMMTKWSIP